MLTATLLPLVSLPGGRYVYDLGKLSSFRTMQNFGPRAFREEFLESSSFLLLAEEALSQLWLPSRYLVG